MMSNSSYTDLFSKGTSINIPAILKLFTQPKSTLLLPHPPEQLISEEDISNQDIMLQRHPLERRIKVLKRRTDLLSSNCWCGCLSVRRGLKLLTDSAECYLLSAARFMADWNLPLGTEYFWKVAKLLPPLENCPLRPRGRTVCFSPPAGGWLMTRGDDEGKERDSMKREKWEKKRTDRGRAGGWESKISWRWRGVGKGSNGGRLACPQAECVHRPAHITHDLL